MGSNRAGPVDIPPEVLRLRDELAKRFRIERMILFGSRAWGEHLKGSDVDLVVVSPDFAGVPFLKRIREIVALWESDLDLEVLPYTPEEFKRKRGEIGIVAVAAAEGIEIPLPPPYSPLPPGERADC